MTPTPRVQAVEEKLGKKLPDMTFREFFETLALIETEKRGP